MKKLLGLLLALTISVPAFASITVSPTKLETVGNRIKATFRNNVEVYFLVDITDNYMTFEIDSELPQGINSVTFANITSYIHV